LLSIRNLLPLGLSLWLSWYFWIPQNDSQKKNHFSNKNNIKKISLSLDSTQKTILIDTPKPYIKKPLLNFKPKDRYGDAFSGVKFGDRAYYFPKLFTPEFKYIPDTSSNGGKYYYAEKFGNDFFRTPTLFSKREIDDANRNKVEEKMLRDLAMGDKAETATSGRTLIPKIPVEAKWFDRIFGGNLVEFNPVGFVNLDFGVQFQRVANPSLPIRQQRNWNFNFDPHANFSLRGKVGEKLRINGNFDTKASFQFENNFKVDYRGQEEDIIRKIEFGNVSFPLPTTLIQGSQNLFGLSTELQFGRLKVRSVFSNQRARIEEIKINGGAQRRNFEVAAGDYEDNRHFFLAQFFRNQYERSLSTIPLITSGVQITRIEVYITNRTNNTEDLRNIVAYLDLGEAKPFRNTWNNNTNNLTARNNANTLLNSVGSILNADNATADLQGLGLENGTDFTVLRAARKLKPNEFVFNSQLGFLSLLTPLRNDEILAVAYEYTFNGQNYKVGELTDDYANRPQDQLVRLKMLRPPSIRLDLPTWDLMMKNVYSLNASQVQKNNFLLRIIYKDDLTGIDNPTLQEGIRMKDKPLLRVVGLDRLNPQNDPQPDGNFDFIDNITIDTRNGRIYFPVLEPFGNNLIGTSNWATNIDELKFDPLTETGFINKYVFDQLYRSTKADALQASDKNKFFIAGSFEGSSGSDVTLPGINISEGSVTVTAGGIPLVEGAQYTVDYATGRVQVTDPAILASGKEIKIQFEKADLFNFQLRRMFGSRFDYVFSPELKVGATLLNLSERPVITRVNVAEEPINNTMLGFDVNLDTRSRFLTRLVDKIPFITTKTDSRLTLYAEYAQLFPGTSRLSGRVSFIDDFEGTRTAFNLGRAPQIGWKLGSTPRFFPESISNQLDYNFKRAKIAWYNIDNLFYRDGTNLRPDGLDLKNHYVRAISPQEVFRNRQRLPIQTNELIFDVAYFPEERGQYNYNPNLNADGLLPNPKQNFGAITRAITSDIDFDNQNIEYLEFWLLDPFIQGQNGRVLDGRLNQNNTTGGDIYFNLGNISEDVIPDGRHAFENGIPAGGANANNTTQNIWGRVTNQQYVNNAFDSDPNTRANQDVGWDGLKSSEERSFPSFQNFVNAINLNVTNPIARENILNDISGDDFWYYLDERYNAQTTQILERYKRFNNYENNSPVSTFAGGVSQAATNNPDNEDLNLDNTISNLEGYYQYKISITPTNLQVGNKYIIDKTSYTDPTTNETVDWYLFRIPIRNFDEKVGAIDGFKSIRFMRMFLTNFSQPVVLRMAQMQLVATQWRRFLGDLSDRTFSLPLEPYDAKFNVSVVNIEENGQPETGVTPYTLPPGVIRDIDVTNINNRRINEQSMRLCVEDLKNRDARAVFRNYRLDFLSYKRVRAYIHAESNNTQSGEVTAFVRLGTDFTDNYYEIEVPLTMTPAGTSDPAGIWPEANWIDVAFEELTRTKVERNLAGQSVVIPYSRIIPGLAGNRYRITVVGNPDLSAVLTSMIGVRNPDLGDFGLPDDKLPKSVCIWINEFRITDFDQTAGWAGLVRSQIKLADFAQINGSLSYTTFGFGMINQRISERTRKTTFNYDISAQVALDKFFPEDWGLKIPMFVGLERKVATPRFNPLDPDVEMSSSLQGIADANRRQEYTRLVQEISTRRSINFTNVRKIRVGSKPAPKIPLPFAIENFGFTWGRVEETRSDINTAEYLFINQNYGLTYTYAPQAPPLEPFKWIKKKSLSFLSDFNFNLLPNITFAGVLDRRFTKTLFRAADRTTLGVEPLFQKQFTFTRTYGVVWGITKSMNITYNATAAAIIDEPFGEINTQENRDSVMVNLRRLGRMKNFTQNYALTYKLPFDKFKLTDFIDANIEQKANFNWIAGAVAPRPGVKGQADTLGHTINNQRERGARIGLDFAKIYKKSKFLEDVINPKPTPPKPKKDPKDTTKKKEPRDFRFLKMMLRPLFSIRKINFTYTMTEQTVLPGFMPTPKYFGISPDNHDAPGWDFVLGSQSSVIKERVIENNWLAPSPFLNTPFTQTKRESINLRIDLEPLPDLRVQLELKRQRQVNYQEQFRFNEAGTDIVSQSPMRNGNLSISTIAFATSLRGDNNDIESSLFKLFGEYRQLIRQRLNAINPNATGVYGINSQDVLLPAFMAAYQGKDPNKVSLSPFPSMPLPNWNIDYNGFTKLFKNVFQTFSIRHSYNANFNVTNYTSSLQYGADKINLDRNELSYLVPNVVNEQGEYVPLLVIGQVTLMEKFSPLIGINFATKGGLTIRLDYNKDRDLSLNLSNAQLSEMNTRGIVTSFGYRKKGLKLPFKVDGKDVILKNELDVRVDMTIRDTKTIQRKLNNPNALNPEDNANPSIVTAGNFNFQIRPVISYMVDKQLTLAAYFEHTINNPYISSSFRRVSTSAGVQLRYNIAAQ
jgi:cell surface protein SprA